MNVSQIKAFLGDQKQQAVSPDTAIKKQLQEEGLRQAAEFRQQQAATVSVSSSQTTIGLKVFSGALEQNVSVDGQKPKVDKKDEKEGKETSLFDFEKVARNVMQFVGGVIQGATKGGADQNKLIDLFAQAREGVAKGIAMAEKDIGGFMNEDISKGINSSRTLIEERLNGLEKRLLGTGDAEQIDKVTSGLSVNASDAKDGNLTIRTKDGDEVKLSFENLREFQLSQQSTIGLAPEIIQNEGAAASQQVASASESLTAQYFERNGISFSLKGELDEGELTAIADLVESANDLADTFFAGEMDKAFEQALSLGFDDQELTGYALQLNRTQKAEFVQAYESIRHYREDRPDANKHGDAASPIAQYLDKMMDVMNQSGEQLESGEDYSELLNSLINRMEDVKVPDLLTAINRFHTFNQRLLDALPSSQPAEETSSATDE
ncbi:DUF5610 domain-containing protein [Alteromonas pelagimontana]|uniref:DUF5610 domain-containing protein n=1 Tax=Alteromonas pelagimontana TaxID=1858656 RepID=A0A6M4MHH0_9ALTE|nr:DUF5610 domain-containing protein [Alteromonas pelagimontana]QJR81626.1 DUF5610 domain-containing protein [Alteromonas pelagimontana]